MSNINTNNFFNRSQRFTTTDVNNINIQTSQDSIIVDVQNDCDSIYQPRLNELKELLKKQGTDITKTEGNEITTLRTEGENKKLYRETKINGIRRRLVVYEFKNEGENIQLLSKASIWYDKKGNKSGDKQNVQIRNIPIDNDVPQPTKKYIFENHPAKEEGESESSEKQSSSGDASEAGRTTEVPAGTLNPAKKVELINLIKSLIKADLTKEYEAGGQIKVTIPADKRGQIPDEGISVVFRFPGSEEKTEVRIEKDTEEFYINVPSDLKPNKAYQLMASVDNMERIVKNITIKAAAAAPEQAQGANAPDAVGGSVKIPTIKSIEFLDKKDKAVAKIGDRKVKPGKVARIKITLAEPNNTGQNIPVYAGLAHDGSKAKSTAFGEIAQGENSTIIEVLIPEDYVKGTAPIIVDINPLIDPLTREWVLNDTSNSYYPGANQRIPIRMVNSLNGNQGSISITIDEAAGEIETKKAALLTREKYDVEGNYWVDNWKDYTVPDLGKNGLSEAGGYWTKTSGEDLDVGLYYQKCPPCKSCEEIYKFAAETIIPNQTGFSGLKIKSATETHGTKPKTIKLGVTTCENRGWELECVDDKGNSYYVFVHADMAKGPNGIADSNLMIYTIQTSNPNAKDADGKIKPAQIDNIDAMKEKVDILNAARKKIAIVKEEAPKEEKK